MVDTVRECKKVQAMSNGSQVDRQKLSLVPGGIPGTRERGAEAKLKEPKAK